MRHSAPISSLCAALLCLAACDSSDCGDNRSSLPLAGFRASSFPTQAIALDSLGIAGIGAPTDSVIDHTTHFVDSVTCPSQVIDNTPGENIFIYFRTDSPDAAPKPVKP